jgi:hypothetical protein
MPSVCIKGWKPGLQKVAMTKALQEHAGFELSAAKKVVDEVLCGKSIRVRCPSLDDAVRLNAFLSLIGADSEVVLKD